MSVRELKDAVMRVANEAQRSGEALNKSHQELSGRGEKMRQVLDGTGHGTDATTAASIAEALNAVADAKKDMDDAQRAAENYAAQL
ncbi:hypothetical protein V5R04_14715 [Jonesiaceae bacterium BS-20]|uniref:Uncharacterized protein n=1 Tax=Jonesiaceae bacterium BS-20 TaxID=3120821 RepID=A0AAU7DVU8_9MICO